MIKRVMKIAAAPVIALICLTGCIPGEMWRRTNNYGGAALDTHEMAVRPVEGSGAENVYISGVCWNGIATRRYSQAININNIPSDVRYQDSGGYYAILKVTCNAGETASQGTIQMHRY